MGKSVIIVAPDHQREWSVVEVGLDKPFSHFEGKDEAIDFAIRMGKARCDSHVKIFNEQGATEAEFIFAARHGYFEQ